MTLPASAHRPGRRETLVAGAALAVLWLALWLAGYPRPNVDDGFFSGAAIELATTGRLYNPWIQGWFGYLPGAHADKFLIQPPLFPLMQAAWLKVFGVSTASLTAWGCSVGWATSCITWQLFRRVGAGAVAAGLAVVVLGSAMLFRGLRPEPLALLCTVGSQYCLLRWRTSPGWLAGGLLGSAAVICHPLWLILVVPATLVQIFHLRGTAAPWRGPLAGLAAGIGLAGGGLVVGLGADFMPFVNDLGIHARFVAPTGTRLGIFLRHFSVGYDFYVNLAVVTLAIGCLGWSRPVAWPAILGWLGLLGLGFFLYAAQSTLYLVLTGALLPLLGFTRQPGWRRALGFAPAVILASWYLAQHTLQCLADRQHDARPQRGAVLAYLAEARPDQVLFDTTTLRTIFDYRPPPGAQDLGWAWSPGRSDRWWSPRHLASRDLWVANPVWSHVRLPDEAYRHRFMLGGRALASVRSSQALLLVLGADLPAPRGLPFIRSASR